VWLRRWSPRLGRELAEARRVGARAEELSAIRDILYEDKWFRIATAVYVHLKKLFAEDGKAGELLEAAERRLFGLRLVDRDGKIAAVRCRAALDLRVKAVFEGAAPGYRLEEAAGAEAAEKTVQPAQRRLGGARVGGGEEGVLRPAGVRRR
jgi:hypothetical protein